MTPELLIVGGPNGAGKTTFAEEYVAQHNCLYLGADAIAAQLAPDDPRRVQIDASRELIRKSMTRFPRGRLLSWSPLFQGKPSKKF